MQHTMTMVIRRWSLVLLTPVLAACLSIDIPGPAQLMSWPQSDQPQLFPAVLASSMAAASSVSNGILIPAGEAWRAALEENPSVSLYGADGYHPGPLGTYLASLVVYEKVTHKDARQLPGKAVVAGLSLSTSETTVRFLQRIAHETVARYPD